MDGISLKQFNVVRLSRDTIIKWMHDEDFASVMKDLYCRVVIRDQSSTKQYRAMRAIRVVDPAVPKPQVELAHGSTVKAYSLEFVSNGPFTDEEFAQYKSTLEKNDTPLITDDEVTEKVNSMRAFLDSKKPKKEDSKRHHHEEDKDNAAVKRKKVALETENKELEQKIGDLSRACAAQDQDMDNLRKKLR
eukprot:TRINITY_DN6044_c0_g1_i1.p1 TRINITY_DN6044_c0_g1~~TRINITY_DN6044_c0_g1_i1.p1  ORF type:complete len:190 (+),score=63.77 TRINITY_DN6044_c0_g1_i1:49-618(+)